MGPHPQTSSIVGYYWNATGWPTPNEWYGGIMGYWGNLGGSKTNTSGFYASWGISFDDVAGSSSNFRWRSSAILSIFVVELRREGQIMELPLRDIFRLAKPRRRVPLLQRIVRFFVALHGRNIVSRAR